MSDHMTVLVTGGAGYIGSHMVLALLDAGHHPVILDDFSTGHEKLLPNGVPVFRGNVADAALVAEICQSYHIDAVAHFAASIVVPESMSRSAEILFEQYGVNNRFYCRLCTGRHKTICVFVNRGCLWKSRSQPDHRRCQHPARKPLWQQQIDVRDHFARLCQGH